MQQRILFIINPNSGRKHGAEIIKLLPKYLDCAKFAYAHCLTTHSGHAIQIATTAVKDKVDVVVAVGGDGLVNEVFQSLVNTDTAFSIIAMGSGNGVARSIGIDMNTKKALSALNKGQLTTMDTVSFNGKPYLGVAGIGFDGLIAREFSKTKKRGLLSYVKLIFKQFAAFRSSQYLITSNTAEYQFDAFTVAIANTQQYGNNAFIAPKAQCNDGQLDLVVIKKHPKWLLPVLAVQIMTRSIHKSKHVAMIRAAKFGIKTSCKQAHIDGEPMLTNHDNEIRVLPRSLNIFS